MILEANKKEYKREFLQSNVYAFECEMRLKLTQQTYHLNKQIKALITHETTATAKRNVNARIEIANHLSMQSNKF